MIAKAAGDWFAAFALGVEAMSDTAILVHLDVVPIVDSGCISAHKRENFMRELLLALFKTFTSECFVTHKSDNNN